MLIKTGESQQLQQFSLLCNTGEGGLFSNVSAAVARGLPTLIEHPANEHIAVVCGGGPSLGDTLVSIRKLKAEGAKIFALNNAARFLCERGIKPDVQIILDPRESNAAFIEKEWADELYLCSQCHPALFDKCEAQGIPVTLWHPAIEGITKYVEKGTLLVGSSLTVGISCLSLIHTLGHRKQELFGYDSSLKDASTHAYHQQLDDAEQIVRCVIEPGEVFYCSLAMSGQANQFKEIVDMLEYNGTSINVNGTGLLPSLFRNWKNDKTERILHAHYDLGLSPASYDFLSFLIESERYRIAHGFDALDIVFQPGPMHGFRDAEIRVPEGGNAGELPDTDAQYGMLWGVCVPMARLLPSVRNIEVLKKRRQIVGDVFPEGYAENRPICHYATAYLKGAKAFLRAPVHARNYARRYGRYATITLRESKHWPTRNSNLPAWEEVARWLTRQGITPVFVPDAQADKRASPFEYCHEAAWDLDIRAALYEGAVINLGVLNGPMSLAAYLDARYLVFKIIVESALASSSEFLREHGFEEGDQFGGNGRLVWKDDSAENIIYELQQEITS